MKDYINIPLSYINTPKRELPIARFKGRDGQSYDTLEALEIADEKWKNANLHYICPICRTTVQVGAWAEHQRHCREINFKKIETKVLA